MKRSALRAPPTNADSHKTKYNPQRKGYKTRSRAYSYPMKTHRRHETELKIEKIWYGKSGMRSEQTSAGRAS